jgi:hypothetical protein
MTLHLQKLSVGSESIATLRDWQKLVVRRRQQKGLSPHHVHVTRMFPKRREALLEGGSIYWVIKGLIQCRNPIVGLEETTKNGHRACAIMMDPTIIPVVPTPRRAFQGWRYLQKEDAPKDLEGPGSGEDLPAALRTKLVNLGAW